MEPPRKLFLTLLNHPATSLRENELLLLWKYICPRLSDFCTVSGSSLKVVDSGRIDRSEGPDVKDVTLRLNGITRTGSVEIHRQTADWYRHGHHRLKTFNTVVLHVVLTGERVKVRREDDHWVETVVLKDYLPEIKSLLKSVEESRIRSRRKSVKRPCYRDDPGALDVRPKLDRAGRVWLDKRAAEIRKLNSDGLLQSTVEALGYSRNHQPFTRLAERIDFEWFREVLADCRITREVEGLLIGLGGWFESSGTFNVPIYRRRRNWDRCWERTDSVLECDQWVRGGVRPQNRPIRRWVNFGWSLRRLYRRQVSWVEWIHSTVEPLLARRDFRRRTLASLSRLFGFPDGNYWKFHYSLTDSPRSSVPSPVGPAWFDQLIVNVLLPYFYWHSLNAGRQDLRRRVLARFSGYPAVLGNRRTKRVLKQWGFPKDSDVYESVRQQQGAVHLYKQGCVRGNCDGCPFNRRENTAGPELFDSPR